MTCPYCNDTGWVDIVVSETETTKAPCQCQKYRSLGGHLRGFFKQPQQQQQQSSPQGTSGSFPRK